MMAETQPENRSGTAPLTPPEATAPLPLDAYPPAQVAAIVESVGVKKAELPIVQTAMLGLLAGAFIAFGAMFYALVGRCGFFAWVGAGRRRRSGTIHRKQSYRNGLGQWKNHSQAGISKLGDCVSRQCLRCCRLRSFVFSRRGIGIRGRCLGRNNRSNC